MRWVKIKSAGNVLVAAGQLCGGWTLKSALTTGTPRTRRWHRKMEHITNHRTAEVRQKEISERCQIDRESVLMI